MYHKIDIIRPNRWWVSVQKFKEQMDALLDRFRFVYLDDYDANEESQAAITFDDAYENVYRHAFPILQKRRIPFEVFVIGNVLGDWNDFEPWEVKTRFCNHDQLMEMAAHGARIQWHTRSHPRLPKLSVDKIACELSVCDDLKAMFASPHFRWFAYPYGLYDRRVVSQVRTTFAGAVSVVNGSGCDRYKLRRIVVDENTNFRSAVYRRHRRVYLESFKGP